MTALSLYQHCAMDEIIYVSRDDGQPLPAQTLDLSDSFMRIRFQEPLDPGTSVKLNFHFSRPDASADYQAVSGEVLDQFRAPEGLDWLVGIRLKFASALQEQNVLSYLSSCAGCF
jgi:hypothetical protein